MEYFSDPTSEETEPHTSKEFLEGSEKLDDTPESVLYTPETDTAEVTSDSMEEHSARSNSLADEISIYYPGSEDPEMLDSDDPNLSGLSRLSPDPSLDCLPRRYRKQRSTTWTYATPEEPPEQRAWNYLVGRNIIELLEKITAGLLIHRFSPPIDYLIEATERARQKNEERNSAEQRRPKKSTNGDGDGESSTDRPNLMDNLSHDGCINIVIQGPTQDDVRAHDETTGDVTSLGGGETDSGQKEEARDTGDWSPMTLLSNYADDEGDGDVTGGVTCFPVLASPQVDLDVEKCDVISPADDETNQSPRMITSTEALKLLSYLS